VAGLAVPGNGNAGKALPAAAPGRACPFRPVYPGGIAVRTMIVVIPQLICCFISTKTEIPYDYGAPGIAGAAASLRTALTATSDH
jgi:hypothetical protein